MSNVIEVKAMNREQAISRALRIAEALPENIVKVVEKQKSRSFFGFFEKEGIYEIEINKEKKVEEKTSISQNLEKKTEEKKVPVEKVEKVQKFEEKKTSPDKTKEIEEKAKILLEYIGLNLRIEIKKINDKNYLVELFGEDNGIIIGKKGKTLNSFEYLLNSMIKDCRIEVDVEGFKEKRNITLRELGKKMAEKALKTGKVVRLNPMPPRERKIIHEVINKYPQLDTFSEGRDPKRYIVIKKKR